METVNHECYVSFEVAKLLKEAGFDWKCNGVFISEDGTQYTFIKMDAAWDSNNSKYNQYNISAPTLDVAQRWLREVKGYDIEIYVCHHYGISAEKGYFHELVINNEDYEDDDISSQFSMTYEDAQEAGIKKALELILEKGE